MEKFTVITGFGYFIDGEGNIYCKANLPLGEHPMKDGYDYVEVETQEILDLIDVYVPAPTEEELNKSKIQNKIVEKQRSEAIADLKADGELPPDYKDKKIKGE